MMTEDATVITTPTDTQFMITREFPLPKNLIYQAWTTPELVQRWMSDDTAEITVTEMDARVDGARHFSVKTNDGTQAVSHGKYLEVVPNEYVVSADEGYIIEEDYVTNKVVDRKPSWAVTITLRVAQADDRTTLTILEEHGSRQGRDEHLRVARRVVPKRMDRLEQLMNTFR